MNSQYFDCVSRHGLSKFLSIKFCTLERVTWNTRFFENGFNKGEFAICATKNKPVIIVTVVLDCFGDPLGPGAFRAAQPGQFEIEFHGAPCLQRGLDLVEHEGLEVIADLDIVVVIHTDTALEPGQHLFDIILEPPQ